MTKPPPFQKDTKGNGVPPGLRAWGSRSWLYLGIALWAFAIISFLGAISGLIVPLTVAIITIGPKSNCLSVCAV